MQSIAQTTYLALFVCPRRSMSENSTLCSLGDFRGHATRHHHLVSRPFDGIVLTDGILGDHVHHVGCAAHGPVGDVEYHPGAGGPHKECRR